MPPSAHTSLPSPSHPLLHGLLACRRLAGCLRIFSVKLSELVISAAAGVAGMRSHFRHWPKGSRWATVVGGGGKVRRPLVGPALAFVFCGALSRQRAELESSGLPSSFSPSWAHSLRQLQRRRLHFRRLLACRFSSRWRVKRTTDRLFRFPRS